MHELDLSAHFGKPKAAPTLVVKIARVAAVILAIVFACFLFGAAIDSGFVPGIGQLGPSWQYAFQDGWGMAEKIFLYCAIGYMLGLVPGGITALFAWAWYAARRQDLVNAKVLADELGSMLPALDEDGDNIVSYDDLTTRMEISKYYSCLTLLCSFMHERRQTICSIHTLPSGKSTYCLTDEDLRSYHGKVWNDYAKAGLSVVAFLVSLIVVGQIYGVLWMFVTEAAVIGLLYAWKTKNLGRLQRFLLREFDAIDTDKDGLISELDLVGHWHNLAASEQANLKLVLEYGTKIGHQKKFVNHLTMQAYTREDIAAMIPGYARWLV